MPYTYLVKCIPEQKYYYGVRYARRSDPSEFWVTYFTSSKKVSELIDKYGKEAFEFEIRRVFDDEFAARKWEAKVLHRLKVRNREDFLNKAEFLWYAGFGSAYNPMKDRTILQINHSRKKKTMIAKYGVESNWKLPEHSQLSRERAIQRNKKPTTCPHCDKTGGFVNMKRYHFDNCKRIKLQ